MKSLFVAWQQPNSREWIPVARLDQVDNLYRFSYTKGVLRAKEFQPFGGMKEINSTYESENLFPLFSNRLISKSRPEYSEYLRWLGLNTLPEDVMTILALTGGVRGTDSIELFPLPDLINETEYTLNFFVRGLPYLPKEAIDRIKTLEENDSLFLMRDCQNKADLFALALRTDDPISFLGYCPKYYVQDLDAALKDKNQIVKIMVSKVNADAPLNMRLLCSVHFKLPEGYAPFSTNSDFDTIAGSSLVDWNNISLSVLD